MSIRYCLADETYKSTFGNYTGNEDGFDSSKRSISLEAAKRDWAAFNVLIINNSAWTLSLTRAPVFSPEGQLENIRLEADVKGFDKHCISMSPVGYVEDDDRSLKTDIILNDETVHVQADRVQPVWVEIKSKKDTKPGIYKGSIRIYSHRMFEDEQLLDTLDFEIKVFDVLMQRPSEYKFHLDLWQHLSNISRKHEVPMWSDEHFEVLEKYVKCLAELGQKAVTVIASEVPWAGQHCFLVQNYLSDMFEYSMISVCRDEEGNFSYDYSAMERYINICLKHGISDEIEVFGLVHVWMWPRGGYGKIAADYPDAIRIRYYDEGTRCFRYMKSANEIKDYLVSLERFFIEKDWIEKVRISADEPADTRLYEKSISVIKEYTPKFKFKTVINHGEFVEKFKEDSSDFVPDLKSLCKEWDGIQMLKSEKGKRLLWYLCIFPDYPNTFISSPLTESRLIGILTYAFGLDGFMRWDFTAWPEKPRERMSWNYPLWKAGDGNFVYPSNSGSPLVALRYMQLKRGIEDYELMKRLEKHYGRKELANKIKEKIMLTGELRDLDPEKEIKKEKLYRTDYETYRELRIFLLNELEGINECMV